MNAPFHLNPTLKRILTRLHLNYPLRRYHPYFAATLPRERLPVFLCLLEPASIDTQMSLIIPQQQCVWLLSPMNDRSRIEKFKVTPISLKVKTNESRKEGDLYIWRHLE